MIAGQEPTLWIIPALLGCALAAIFGRAGQKDKNADIWRSRVVLDLRAQIAEMEKRYQAQMEFFVNFPEVVKTLTGALTVGQVNAAMSRGISMLLEPEQTAIFLSHAENKLRLVDGAGYPEELRGRFECPVDDGNLLPLLEHRGVCRLRDHPDAQDFLLTLSIRAQLAAPIWYGGRMLGLIAISEPSVERLMGTRILAMLADMMSVSLHSAGVVAEIRKKAERDAMTGLPNRRSLMERVLVEVQRCQAYQSKLSLVMIDVDHFKHYNDRNGHGAGDEALKRIASALAGTIRRTDLAARYGGEEFTILIQSADHGTALFTAERARMAIERAAFAHGEHQPLGRVTISLGLATFPDDASDVSSLFKAADSALYVAKEQGRNRVVVYEGPHIKGNQLTK